MRLRIHAMFAALSVVLSAAQLAPAQTTRHQRAGDQQHREDGALMIQAPSEPGPRAPSRMRRVGTSGNHATMDE
jgi:hypothetical protein